MEEIKQEWEETNARNLGMCCPGCDCGHCEIRRSLVNKIVDLAVSKEQERRDAQIIEFINSGEPAPWNDTGWSVELSDVEKFIKNTK